jgi:ribonuclease III
VLGLVVSEELMQRHPAVDEGELSWMRQAVVARDSCAAVAATAGLPEAFVRDAPPPKREAAADLAERPSVRAALAEAVIGASWLDLGANATREGVRAAFGPALEAARPGARDPKTTLQEEAARRRLSLTYEVTDAQGPPERRVFTSVARVGGEVMGEGTGPSKQASEQAAAGRALARLGGV